LAGRQQLVRRQFWLFGSWWLLQFRGQHAIVGKDESSSELEQAAVKEWAVANKLSADTFKLLIKEGFITMEVC
jgi:hypothetical protein